MCRSCSWAVYTLSPKKEKKNCLERIFYAWCVMHMKFEVWLFLSRRWNVRKKVNWSKPQWIVGHSWARMSCWGRFFAVLITVVRVASFEPLAGCTRVHWRMPGLVSVSRYSLQGEVWMLQLMFQSQLNYPCGRGRALQKGWGRCLGFGKCWSHLRKKLSPLGNESPYVCSVWAL